VPVDASLAQGLAGASGAPAAARAITRVMRGDILIVDDTPIIADVLTGLLSTTACQVRVARNGRDALAAVRARHPDLVLLDISMPDMDGYEVCRRLKADLASADIPVIFISALDESMDKVLAFEVGGADYVQKPFEPAEVLARIAYQLEITRLQADMRAANARLLELDALKSTITAMLVHDLRSPLTVVQMVLDAIAESAAAKPEAIPELAATASAGVTKIIGLVSEMLDVYRSDATGKTFPLRALDVNAALTRAFEFARVAARYGEIHLELDVEPRLPRIMGNEEKLDRALTNLLSNAIKFTPRGGAITLSASNRAEPGRRPRLAIAVTDTGWGIPEADLRSVFDPYRQAKSHGQTKGVGLGLAIVKRIVDGHHGTVTVDSEVGRGTTFTIEIEAASEGPEVLA
jgi:two-component system, sensor histidine kinase and response regulator